MFRIFPILLSASSRIFLAATLNKRVISAELPALIVAFLRVSYHILVWAWYIIAPCNAINVIHTGRAVFLHAVFSRVRVITIA
ncbi:hypothetical protein AYI70_g940 [Smittium culicis]|uniref:Uncharacterized protein n=1 Tax=Smittium culicis TaxID=133412 RepID=A0A1R1YEP2_9FUNG|nr:hypothetical protein AYI70_g940 [Smittium culicis]